MTVHVGDAYTNVQRLVLVVKMTTVLEGCTTEEQHYVVRFLRAKGLNANDIHKENVPVYGGICRKPLGTDHLESTSLVL
jgi:hypothetical protein